MIASRIERSPWSRAALFAACVLIFLSVLSYPYAPDSVGAAFLMGYIESVAKAAAYVIRLGDDSALLRQNVSIEGRMSLQIVLDCTGLDVQALYLAAVIAAPAPVAAKLVGSAAGTLLLYVANIARIVLLYFAGSYAPRLFDLLHEDVLSLAMVVCAGLAFVSYLLLLRNAPFRVRLQT